MYGKAYFSNLYPRPAPISVTYINTEPLGGAYVGRKRNTIAPTEEESALSVVSCVRILAASPSSGQTGAKG